VRCFRLSLDDEKGPSLYQAVGEEFGHPKLDMFGNSQQRIQMAVPEVGSFNTANDY